MLSVRITGVQRRGNSAWHRQANQIFQGGLMIRVDKEVAVLFADPDGIYRDFPEADIWGTERDAHRYMGDLPVICHPPCARWSKMWYGSPLVISRGGQRKKLGDDGGCFEKALEILNSNGGVLEHPAYSKAWEWFGLPKPCGEYFTRDLVSGYWVCRVNQFDFGHPMRKPTWLLYVGGEPRIQPEERRIERNDKNIYFVGSRRRSATPPKFAEYLLELVTTSV